MKFQPASDRSLLISFDAEISPRVHREVFRLYRALKNAALPGVLNLHPAYCSVLVDFDPLAVSHSEMETKIAGIDAAAELPPPREVRIPVMYDGPDLAAVAVHHGITPARVVELHSSAEYLVYFLGFSPGFPYLAGLPPQLATPRLETPRKHVPAGSVAIGGSQTGIYPLASPGGWRIIGRTELRLFDAAREQPALIAMGDVVKFEPV
jgi:inhibitor of KinA